MIDRSNHLRRCFMKNMAFEKKNIHVKKTRCIFDALLLHAILSRDVFRWLKMRKSQTLLHHENDSSRLTSIKSFCASGKLWSYHRFESICGSLCLRDVILDLRTRNRSSQVIHIHVLTMKFVIIWVSFPRLSMLSILCDFLNFLVNLAIPLKLYSSIKIIRSNKHNMISTVLA